jgi:hypothetical protein
VVGASVVVVVGGAVVVVVGASVVVVVGGAVVVVVVAGWAAAGVARAEEAPSSTGAQRAARDSPRARREVLAGMSAA